MGRPTPLTAAQRRALAGLKRAGLLGEVYLAGGSAVAHHLGHRRSNDLDLFSAEPQLAKRGVRRDYWDLYEMLSRTRLTLRAACDDYRKKFGVTESDLYHVLRALTWFEDAESDPTPPRGLSARKWAEIRSWFETHAGRELLRRTNG